MDKNQSTGILFYDGDCGLCSRSVRFLLRRDRANALKFAPLQGETAKKYLPAALWEQRSTVIYYRSGASGETGGQCLLRSEAVLCALIDTGSTWRWPARILRFFPQPWRDAAYEWVACNRHRFFPKGSCALPTSEERAKLLD